MTNDKSRCISHSRIWKSANEVAASPAAPRNHKKKWARNGKGKEPRSDRRKLVRLLHRDLTSLAIGV